MASQYRVLSELESCLFNAHRNQQHAGMKFSTIPTHASAFTGFHFVFRLTRGFPHRSGPTFLALLLWRPSHSPFDGNVHLAGKGKEEDENQQK